MYTTPLNVGALAKITVMVVLLTSLWTQAFAQTETVLPEPAAACENSNEPLSSGEANRLLKNAEGSERDCILIRQALGASDALKEQPLTVLDEVATLTINRRQVLEQLISLMSELLTKLQALKALKYSL